MESRAVVDVVPYLEKVRTPTLVVHARDDQVVPLAEGRLMASGIPGAQFVELDSKNHILLENEPAWERFRSSVLEFTGREGEPAGEDPAFRSLTSREREVLGLLTRGLGNADIAGQLSLSEKTVRNQSRICSTSSVSGREPRRSCLRGTGASRLDSRAEGARAKVS